MDIIEHTEGFVPGPGFYRMPAKVYHADPCPEPSLSSSIARVIVEQSPEHAYAAHPRLGLAPGADEKEATRPREIGTAVHKLLLGQGTDLVVIDADDYRSGYAKSERALAYEAGSCPILRPDAEKAEMMADEAVERLREIEGCEGFGKALSEIVAIVRDPTGAWLRIMMDKVEIGERGAVIWDVKSGDQSAAPQDLGRRVESMGMEIQRSFYVHVLEQLLPHLAGRITFRWLFVENDVPHAVSVAEADGAASHVGARKVSVAIHRWNAARATDIWPSYPPRIVRIEYPEYAAKRWTEREELDPQLAGVSYDLAKSPFRPLDMESAA